MTRINTNLSSLSAQHALSRTTGALSTSLERLSTGYRINTGKDDPAGLIASETLRSEQAAIRQSIKNSERATNIVATADAALAEVSSLLNNLRSLVQSSANKGAISASEIAANQVELDSALESIARIGQTTVFAGEKLLNGTKSFSVNATGGSLGAFQSTADITINSFNPALHSSTAGDDVTIAVTAAATRRTVTLLGQDATSGNNVSLNDLSTSSTRRVTTLVGNDFTIGDTDSLNDLTTASTRASQLINSAGGTDGLDDLTGAGADTVTFTVTGDLGASAGIVVNVDAFQADINVLRDAINAVSATTGVIADVTGGDVRLRSSFVGAAAVATITATAATQAGDVAAFNDAVTEGGATAGTTGAATPTTFTVTGNIGSANVVLANNDTLINHTSANLDAFVAQINGVQAQTGVTAARSGNNIVLTSGGVGASSLASISAAGANAGLVAAAGTQSSVAGVSATSNTTTLELIGDLGRSVITFQNDAVINNSTVLVNAINAVTSQTGITASSVGGQGANVVLTSQKYGSAAVVTANAIAADVAGDITTFNAGGTQTAVAGTNAVGTVTHAQGSGAFSAIGEVITYADSSISISAVSNPALGNLTANFDVTGGALFQIGPIVNFANQVNVNITSLDLNTLGRNFTSTGNRALASLKTGGSDVLSSSDLSNAALVIEQAISQVSTLRGRLGSLQKNVLESNIRSLQSGLEQVTASESTIRDADFAEETAALTRAQILSSAGTSVLSIANQSPQNVLALLQ
jgi:flagellin